MRRVAVVGCALLVFWLGSVVRFGSPSVAQEKRIEGAPARGAFFPEKLAQMDTAIAQAISSNQLPGGVLWFERNGEIHRKALGLRAILPAKEPMTEDTIFDAASLTKVMATAPAILILMERGLIKLEEPVWTYLPDFRKNGKESVTVRHLLAHTSGLRSGIPAGDGWSGYGKGIALACEESPTTTPGTQFHYSDINFIVLGELVQRVGRKPLADFVANEIFAPLKMRDTGYLPPAAKLGRIAPTERQGNNVLRGEVHDPTARRMGGVAGHAGIFTTAADLARFARMWLNGGSLEGVQILKPETVRLATSVQSLPESGARRGLGWDIDSPYAGPRGKYFPVGSFGHTGWTGTSVWIDPFSRTFLIFLSNRNHPDESGNVIGLRRELGGIAAEAVRDFNFAYVPGALEPMTNETKTATRPARQAPSSNASAQNGIDVLRRQKFAPLKGLRIGLITNHTGADRERNPTIDLLHKADGIALKMLFSPEHGIRGALDENVGDSVDEKTGLPIYSLFGARKTPAAEQLKNLDALVFDIQDIGCRFYTYVSTMGNCLEAAGKSGLRFFVLDRVNPITGTAVEGPILAGESSFTGFHTIPVRHGMTVGELAQMFNEERKFNAKLTVVPVEGWRRESFYDETGLPWINPSPNMRSLTEAILYPGIGLLETTALSVGRGTDTPFELVGAPYIDDLKLAAALNNAGLAGVRFVPTRFTPKASVFQGKSCGGVNIILTDRDQCRVVDVGIAIALALQKMYPNDFGVDKFNRLLSHPETVKAVREGRSLAEIKSTWEKDASAFLKRRERYLIYK